MNPLVANTIENAAYQNYFEDWQEGADILLFSSTRHPNEVAVADDGTALFFYSHRNAQALLQAFAQYADGDCLRIPHPPDNLVDHLHLLGALFEAAATLPFDPDCPDTPVTEVLAQVKERLGQHLYRDRLLNAWDDACAVTGITDPRLLRASHAKPWRDASDAERLDPANGLPLAVHLDALFDAGLITFEDDGAIRISSQLSPSDAVHLAVTSSMRLRHPLSPAQRAYMSYHREEVFLP